jgi:hypothetical protein
MNAGTIIANAEVERLAQTALELAKTALADQASFLPGSIAVRLNGKYDLAVAATGGAPGSNMLITALRQKAAAGLLRAAAIYRDVRVRPQGASEDVDAIHVVVELASGGAVHMFQVYRRSSAGQILLGERELQPAPSVIFAAPSKRWWEFWK